ncbi:MAG: BlaI/MecI/CopY family transcriptional regulator [Paludisphaera borealis]|uniref:BlaI/MecI/CopY family transcriptional regulator n=1 Tax=Paludisphaera borealis TaxID=1387353 RepID=UPI002844A99E|nr:BlaI/MecI/CopY family transcriptional regulator [Paludisphaera borealis]MDR3621220.1 BlaI/MecI/CopY family transcriptional regulator [Paludisphaera borealis]
MARGRSETLTAREAQIMDVVWRLGEATAEQIREGLEDRPHDSTIRTLLRILETKGFLAHEARGKAYLYRAAVERERAQGLALRSMLTQFFRGSAEDLVLRLIEDEQITPEQLDELRRASPAPSPKVKRASRRGGEGKDAKSGG